jgi:hypothetical protein
MKKIVLLYGLAFLVSGCQLDPDAEKTARTPQFGTPASTIPWNKPEGWEQSGQLGSMPGIGEPH